ncbi:hypothetical protein MGSAQ_000740 [marine sediment metagenome]|uniref:Uncharacterized protein n=1 Tax=marine sediment metagenome TaxID=412755 RepID=A0A1B6NWC9_9ZZZZ
MQAILARMAALSVTDQGAFTVTRDRAAPEGAAPGPRLSG